MPLLIFAVAGVALWYFSTKSIDTTTPDDNSRLGDDMSSKDLSLIDSSVSYLIDELGQPYVWGDNDCSEWLLRVARANGLCPADWPDMNTLGIANACDKVEIGYQEPGDFAYYNGHVMMVCSYPIESNGNHSAVVGMSGGGRGTDGTDPNACVKLFDRANYRSDFVCYMRPKP